MRSAPSKNPAQPLLDIVENIDAVAIFLAEMRAEEFVGDKKTVYAVTRALEIVSEATRRLPPELKARHPGIDWVAIAAAGNVYRHEYGRVAEARIWNTAQHDLAGLRQAAAEELKRLESTP